jgi:hypothetical protein
MPEGDSRAVASGARPSPSKPEADPATGKSYEMKQGDFFTVRVVNQNKTMATKIQEIMYGRAIMAEKIFVNYGGMIKDEGN